ncbi:MAG: hypothetical protein LUF82_02290 [Clostridia bacterium]|nr:hypothetical protein [Clostridia bacterium]
MYSKRYYLKSKFRMAMIMLLSIIMAMSLFFAAACSDDDDDDTEKTTSTSDTQTILNGNFEFFSDSDDETYIIYTPNSWSSTTSGSTNYVMNGIVDTSDAGWSRITDPDLAATLDYNNSLDEDDDDYDDEYVDYNGMKSRDIPYKNTYAGINGESLDGNDTYYTLYGDEKSGYYVLNDSDEQVTVFYDETTGVCTDENGDVVYIKSIVDNPQTHNVITTVSGEEYDAYYVADTAETHAKTDYEAGDKVLLYADDDGNYYYDADFEYEYESHVLMIHNYVNDDTRYGTAQSYTSSTSVSLEPNTAAELSVWVKTSELIYDRNGSEIYEGRGAYIEIEQTVGGSAVDSLYIENIRTDGVTDNNGWVKYTIYVNGCDFATSTVTVTVGLGQAESSSDYSEVCEGYAFFDDVKCTVYSSLTKTSLADTEDAGYTINSCDLTSEEDEKIFKIEDKVADDSTSYYLIDLSSQADHVDTKLNSGSTSTVSVDYTRDSDYYIVSNDTINGYNIESSTKYTAGSTYKYNLLTTATLNTGYDVLGIFDLNDLETDIKNAFSSGAGYSYYSDTIQSVLEGATTLPNYSDEDNDYALMILSAYGAAYTATVTDTDNFTVNSGEYKIVSFWLKTSDMAGFTAATVSLYAYKYDADGNLLDAEGNITTDITKAVIDTSMVSSLALDTSSVTFDAGDEEDIYGGWVQCFFYVENTTDYDITFEMQIGFGNTTIKDTTASDYKAGYLAVTNIQTMDVDEDIFSLASTSDYAASFTMSTSDSRENNYFDTTAAVNSNDIESNITSTTSYTGVNGGSASVVYKSDIDSSGLDSRNSNGNSGLLNQDYWDNYVNGLTNGSSGYEWLKLILEYKGCYLNDALISIASWSDVFGSTSIQPLLIANTVRTYVNSEDETSYAMNYGYIANSATSVSSDSYEIITVKVYVSKGAVAYVYLTEKDGNSSEVMSLDLPDYNLWYDSQGNVLDGEPDYDDDSYKVSEHIVYYLRDDGLYEDKDGNLFANLSNYSRMYYDQQATYYEEGATQATLYEELDSDTIYYTDTTYTTQSAHYLIAYDSDGSYTRVFRYDYSYFGDSSYHYIITETDDDDEEYVTYSDAVANFDVTDEMIRYDNTAADSEMYVVIDARYTSSGELATTIADAGYDKNGNYVADTWQTVNFYIHTGDTSYDYTLELWSGARTTTGVDEDGNVIISEESEAASLEGSFVVFDYSSVTVDEDSYADLLEEYTDEIIDAYVRLLNATGNLSIKDNEQNLSYYKNLYDGLVADGTIDEDALKSDESTYSYWRIINNIRSVVYYTYSLYDDAGYVPFNAETAEDDETGYTYSVDDYEETLSFLSYSTGSYADDKYNTYTGNYVTFVDYSAVDVTVESGVAADEEEEDEDSDSTLNVWLLVASIILAVVLILTMISILIRDIVKRIRRKRVNVKNVYSGKRKHYIRKLGLTETTEEPEEAEETSEPEKEEEAEEAEQPEETAEPEETSAEETPAEDDGTDGEGKTE